MSKAFNALNGIGVNKDALPASMTKELSPEKHHNIPVMVMAGICVCAAGLVLYNSFLIRSGVDKTMMDILDIKGYVREHNKEFLLLSKRVDGLTASLQGRSEKVDATLRALSQKTDRDLENSLRAQTSVQELRIKDRDINEAIGKINIQMTKMHKQIEEQTRTINPGK